MNNSLASLITYFEVLGLNQSFLEAKLHELTSSPNLDLFAIYHQFDLLRTGSFGFYDLCNYLENRCFDSTPEEKAAIFKVISQGSSSVTFQEFAKFLGFKSQYVPEEKEYTQQLEDNLILLFEQILSNHRRAEAQKLKLFGGKATLFSFLSCGKSEKVDVTDFLRKHFLKDEQTVGCIVRALGGNVYLNFETFCELIEPVKTESYFLLPQQNNPSIAVSNQPSYRMIHQKSDGYLLSNKSNVTVGGRARKPSGYERYCELLGNNSFPIKSNTDIRSTFNTTVTTETIDNAHQRRPRRSEEPSHSQFCTPNSTKSGSKYMENQRIIEESYQREDATRHLDHYTSHEYESGTFSRALQSHRNYIQNSAERLHEMEDRMRDLRQKSEARRAEVRQMENDSQLNGIRRVSSHSMFTKKMMSNSHMPANEHCQPHCYQQSAIIHAPPGLLQWNKSPARSNNPSMFVRPFQPPHPHMRQNKSSLFNFTYGDRKPAPHNFAPQFSQPVDGKLLTRCTSGFTLGNPPPYQMDKRVRSPENNAKPNEILIQEELTRSKNELQSLKKVLQKLETEKENKRSSTGSNFKRSTGSSNTGTLGISVTEEDQIDKSDRMTKNSSNKIMIREFRETMNPQSQYAQPAVWQSLDKSQSTQYLDVLDLNSLNLNRFKKMSRRS